MDNINKLTSEKDSLNKEVNDLKQANSALIIDFAGNNSEAKL